MGHVFNGYGFIIARILLKL